MFRALAVACSILFGSSWALGASDERQELAKQEQNPLARLIRVQFEENAQMGFGPDDEVLNFFRIQPIVPFGLTEDWSLIARPIIPIAHLPFPETEDGLSDVNLQLLVSPERAKKFVWGLGPSFLFPTATDESIGTEKWAAGPAAAVIYLSGPWVIGASASQLWSFAGDDDRADVDAFAMRPVVNYNLSRGWFLTSSPLIVANWDVDRDDRWLVPVGGGLGKVSKIAGQAVSLSLESFYHAVSPDIGPDWQLRLQLTFLFPR